VVCAVFGALLVLVSGGVLVATQVALNRVANVIPEGDLFGGVDPGEDYGRDITGPVNILLAGLDTRPSRPDETPRADAIMVVHVNRTLDRGYLISLPRDTLVDIPAEPAVGYPGGRDRINAAMFHGANPLPGVTGPDVERGFALLARTVSDLTGIERFDAGVVLNFVGFRDIVDAMGGVTVELTERIVSEHRAPDGTHRPVGCGSYCGPQMVYEPGVDPCGEASGAPDGTFRCEFEGWHALDVVRQRKSLGEGDYGRQENQQRVLRAMMDQALRQDLVTNPVALNRLLQAIGDSMIFDGRGNRVVDFAFALRNLRSGSMEMISLPADGVGIGDAYQGEQLREEALGMFAAIRADEVDQYLLDHPDIVGG
jgi:LCP family protein required for cell wall assembly